jgi:DNA-binding NarL/FixJ family response regulator
MNGYVAKPLRREDLFQAIAAVLQGREAPVRAEA